MVSQPFIYMCVGQYTIAMVEVTTQEYVYNISCIQYFLYKYCCDVAVAQINYPSLKHNTQDSIEQARGRYHEEGSNQIFMLDNMQFGGVLDVI